MGRRFDIQVLRGVAVLLVVLHHAFPTVVRGGKLGVDVFLVLSGFLIIGLVLRGLEDRRFGFAAFYVRRARRLLPALTATAAGTTALALLVLSPAELLAYAKQVVVVAALLANMIVAHPSLTHLWSLSLEEQFYLLIPLLLWLIPGWLRPGLLALGLLLSLALYLLLLGWPQGLPIDRAQAWTLGYGSLPARAWQFLAGGLCAWLMMRRPGLTVPPGIKWLALAGLLFVGTTGTLYEGPRWAGMIVTAATCVMLMGRDGWLPRRALGPIARTGDLSYSLYLVHWPLFYFAHHQFGQTLPFAVIGGVLALSLVWAALQYRHVEQRFRLPARNAAPPVAAS